MDTKILGPYMYPKDNPLESKILVLSISPFFLLGLKLQPFATMVLKTHTIAKNNLKETSKLKNGATSSTLILELKLQPISNHGVKDQHCYSENLKINH